MPGGAIAAIAAKQPKLSPLLRSAVENTLITDYGTFCAVKHLPI